MPRGAGRPHSAARVVGGAVATAVLLAACTSPPPAPEPAAGAPGFDPAATAAAAQTLLTAWSTSHAGDAPTTVVATGELVTQIGSWTDGTDPGDRKLAFVDGLIVLAGGVAVTGDVVGSIRYADGSTVTVPTLAVGDAVRQDAPARSPQSTPVAPLLVVGARATTTTLATVRGPAVVPAWELTVADTPVRLVAVAVPATVPSPVVTPGRDLPGVGVGLTPVGAVTVGSDGRTLTVGFTGAPEDASTFCGEDYTAQAVADDDAVVLSVVRHPYTGPTPSPSPGADAVGCSLVGAARSAVTVLDAPLDGRPVLDLVTAVPVPVALVGRPR